MTKRFHFHLQPILDIREGAEQRAREELAERMAVRSQGRQNLETAEDLVNQADVAARQRAQAPVSAAELAAQQLCASGWSATAAPPESSCRTPSRTWSLAARRWWRPIRRGPRWTGSRSCAMRPPGRDGAPGGRRGR